MDNVVISHDDICLASNRAYSKCGGLTAKSIEDNSWRLDSTSMDGSPRCKVFFGTKGNMWLTRGRADRFGVVGRRSLPIHKRLQVLRADKLHLMSERFELARP